MALTPKKSGTSGPTVEIGGANSASVLSHVDASCFLESNSLRSLVFAAIPQPETQHHHVCMVADRTACDCAQSLVLLLRSTVTGIYGFNYQKSDQEEDRDAVQMHVCYLGGNRGERGFQCRCSSWWLSSPLPPSSSHWLDSLLSACSL